MNVQIAPCGGFWFDADTMELIQDGDREVLSAIGGGDGDGASIACHNRDPEAHELIQLDCGDLG